MINAVFLLKKKCFFFPDLSLNVMVEICDLSFDCLALNMLFNIVSCISCFIKFKLNVNVHCGGHLPLKKLN